MAEDERCCGTGTCLINAEGTCWCGQRWDGEKMCFPEKDRVVDNTKAAVTADLLKPGSDSANRSS